MAVVEFDRIEVDFCTRCYGVWFDAGEIELLLERGSFEHAGLGLQEALRQQGPRVSEKGKHCPVCRRKMRKVNIGPAQQVLIDVCPQEDGIWFDSGELDQLIEQMERSGVAPSSKQDKVGAFLRQAFKARHEATSHQGGTA